MTTLVICVLKVASDQIQSVIITGILKSRDAIMPSTLPYPVADELL